MIVDCFSTAFIDSDTGCVYVCQKFCHCTSLVPCMEMGAIGNTAVTVEMKVVVMAWKWMWSLR